MSFPVQYGKKCIRLHPYCMTLYSSASSPYKRCTNKPLLITSKGNAYCFLYTNQQKHNTINKQKVSEVEQGVWKTEMSPRDLEQDYLGCLQHKKEETKLTRANTVYLLGPRVCIHLNLPTLTVFLFVKYIIIV